MWRIVNTFETKESEFSDHSYLYHDTTYVCEIKDFSLINEEILHDARYINSFTEDNTYKIVE